MSSLNGMPIVASVFALEIRVEYSVERHPTKKRRRNWRVVRRETRHPAAFEAGGQIIMHPDLIARLPRKDQP